MAFVNSLFNNLQIYEIIASFSKNYYTSYYLSTDNGDSWQEKYGEGIIGSEAFGQDNFGQLYMGNEVGEVSRSTDDGVSWEQVGFGRCNGVKGSCGAYVGFVFEQKERYGWYGCRKTKPEWFNQWLVIQQGETSPSCIDSLGNYWDICGKSTSISTDRGKTWTEVDTNLKHNNWNFFEVAPNGYIYASAVNGGLYRSRDRFVSVQEEPNSRNKEFSLSPNPATDFLEITYSPSIDRRVNPTVDGITIYNVFGIKIPPCLTAPSTPQEGNLQLDVSGLSPGVYFVRVGKKVGKFVKI